MFMIDNKLLHDTTHMKVKVSDAQKFRAKSWCYVTHKTTVNRFLKCGFNLNQTCDGADATKLGIAEDH